MKILIAGAHFTPAQAVIEELKRNSPEVEIIYLGRSTTLEGSNLPSVESQVLPKLGVKFVPLIAGRLRKDFSFLTIISFLKIPIGFIQAFFYLLKYSPAVVVSFGGYVGLPVVASSWLLSIPILIHEQTLVSGLANSISKLFANKVALSFENNLDKKNSNSGKVFVSGNPIRKELVNPSCVYSNDLASIIQKAKKEHLPLILFSGGNQGSHFINKLVQDILDELVKISFVVHQTGDSPFNDFESLETAKKQLSSPNRYLARKWIDVNDWSNVLLKTDLVICRSGANTLYELAYLGVPAITIPIPYLYKDEQTKNAKYYQKLGLVKLLTQEGLNSKTLLEAIKEDLKNLSRLKKSAGNAKKVVDVNAAKKLILEALTLNVNV